MKATKPTNRKLYSDDGDEVDSDSDETVTFPLRIPKRLQLRIAHFIDQEYRGAPRLRNWFINKWISEGLKREGEGY